ncbi:MAG: IucA/IucC family protein [Actinocatenispora sp.]
MSAGTTDAVADRYASGERWREVNRRLLAKALGEWVYEGLLEPTVDETGGYQVALDGGDPGSGVAYTFRAEPGAFGWLRVDPATIRRHAAGLLGNRAGAAAWDVQRFVVDATTTIGTDAVTVANYLGELAATLTADEAMLADPAPPAAELRKLGHAELEGCLTGHPWIVANKGRVGFSGADLRRYAPESRTAFRLPWLAVHRGLAEFRATPGLAERTVRRAQLGDETVDRFARRLSAAGLDPDSYVWLPAHPWQWENVIPGRYAAEVAQGRIVPLGDGPDEHLPQQSVRTLTNLGERGRYDVKLPLSILNTSVWRGLPPHCTRGAPIVTQWLHGLFGQDPFLRDETRTVFLGEVASVTVPDPYLSNVDGAPYRHLETLGCIWREPVSAHAEPDERVRALSALLHADDTGRAFVAELVAASGRPATEWLRALFDTLLTPVLYVMYRYGITFNPHGQNALIGYGPDELPRRLFLKDFIDDVELSATDVPERLPEPDSHPHLVPRKPAALIRQHVVDSVLIGHFRYLAPLCADQLGVPAATFWSLVRDSVLSVRQRFPELGARCDEYDLLTPRYPRYRLNADRLVVTGYQDQALRHALRDAGTVPNPLVGG